MKQPCYIGLDEARQVLAEMGVKLSLRQMQRAAEQDAQGRRKLELHLVAMMAEETGPLGARNGRSDHLPHLR